VQRFDRLRVVGGFSQYRQREIVHGARDSI
jgi:hypothetical protein